MKCLSFCGLLLSPYYVAERPECPKMLHFLQNATPFALFCNARRCAKTENASLSIFHKSLIVNDLWFIFAMSLQFGMKIAL